MIFTFYLNHPNMQRINRARAYEIKLTLDN